MSECRYRALLLLFSCAWMLRASTGEAKDRPTPAPAAEDRAVDPVEDVPAGTKGYLTSRTLPASRDVLPPPPAPGSPGEALDRAAFFTTRQLKGTPRWDLAVQDARYSPKAFLASFSCVLGFQLDESNAPTLLRVFNRLRSDVGAAVESAKSAYKHPRPFLGTGQPICENSSDYLKASWSYPSGHATIGWTSGLLLAELVPELSAPLMARARAYGESRVVCGVHTVSDVEAGRTVGAVLVAALHGSDEFKAELERARREVSAAREAARAPVHEEARCAAEKDAATLSPWLGPPGK